MITEDVFEYASSGSKSRGFPWTLVFVVTTMLALIGIPLVHFYFGKEAVKYYIIFLCAVIVVVACFFGWIVIQGMAQASKRSEHETVRYNIDAQRALVDMADVQLANFVQGVGHLMRPATEQVRAERYRIQEDEKRRTELLKTEEKKKLLDYKEEQKRERDAEKKNDRLLLEMQEEEKIKEIDNLIDAFSNME